MALLKIKMTNFVDKGKTLWPGKGAKKRKNTLKEKLSIFHLNFYFLSKYVLFSFHSLICICELFGESPGFLHLSLTWMINFLTFPSWWICAPKSKLPWPGWKASRTSSERAFPTHRVWPLLWLHSDALGSKGDTHYCVALLKLHFLLGCCKNFAFLWWGGAQKDNHQLFSTTMLRLSRCWWSTHSCWQSGSRWLQRQKVIL